MTIENAGVGEGAGAEGGETTPPATPPAQGAAAGQRQRGEFIPTATIGKMKKEAREKGERMAIERREAEAKAAGFGSYDEMIKYAAEQKRRPASQQAAPPSQQRPAQGGQPSNGISRRDFDRLNSENAKLKEENVKLRKENTRLTKNMRAEAREHTEAVANLELRFTAIKNGVKPALIPAAVALYREMIPAQNEGEDDKAYYARLRSFKDDEAYGKLREEHGYLFGGAAQAEPPKPPPTTGNGARVPAAKAPNAPPGPPEGGGANAGNGNGGSPKSVMEMSPAQVRAYLESKGLPADLAD